MAKSYDRNGNENKLYANSVSEYFVRVSNRWTNPRVCGGVLKEAIKKKGWEITHATRMLSLATNPTK